ncbi:MAG: UDP-N-acetylglucosamine 2-epimerase [Candidatus Gottesmanbacteria bacterium GW2011_GWB1_49_7]|uniref:UDP-N-acetylglucosamine 2-epimerase n=1 Tax=Candidatus Gottesmanbacteria bacterium GW2011_GWB1_49_7 TaxID=1618448 RepID=A0A0G1W1I1_9BACT|nr:MAG: UDP-N-acetylglucosamine 2-epimerase [Candidatus Gottesmanbacteria bacterium GW2011_GWB1_49_7]
MSLTIAVQIECLPSQEVAFRPLIDEIERRKDVKLSPRVHAEIGIVQGDTWETLDAATKFLKENIPIAHLYGGDITRGGFPDDNIRNAVSMLSDYHFPSTLKSAENLAKLGLDKSRIFAVGDPIFDLINTPRDTAQFYAEHPKLNPDNPLVLILLHDDPNSLEDTNHFGRELVMGALADYQGFAINPTGQRMGHEVWFKSMAAASVFVTNSSSGIAEAPSFNLPCVQVGNRQKGRETAGNVLWAGYDADDIREKVKIALEWKRRGKTWDNPYDIFKDQNNSSRIIDKLVEVMT